MIECLGEGAIWCGRSVACGLVIMVLFLFSVVGLVADEHDRHSE